MHLLLLIVAAALAATAVTAAGLAAAAAIGASYKSTNRCGSGVSGHPAWPVAPDPRTEGVEIIYSDYNLTVCNNTAWTFRSLWHGGAAVLTPTGFAQTVSNVNLHKHACPPPAALTSRTETSGWTECLKLFGCPAVGLLEGVTLKSAIQWAAVFDPIALRGAVYQYPVGYAYPGRAGFENSFWNRPYDHKLYLPARGIVDIGRAAAKRLTN